jgi:uncharacterized protein (TIGR03086 family)
MMAVCYYRVLQEAAVVERRTGWPIGGSPMSDPMAMYDRVITHFSELVDSISNDQWSLNTPCEGWTVRDLMQHRDGSIAASMGGARVDEPAPDADLIDAWHKRVSWWAAGLADPIRSEAVWQTGLGEMTFREATMRMMTGELTIHAWDLARALGLEETLDPESVHVTYVQLRAHGDQLRRPGVMGPAVEAPDGASEQTQLIALTGRSV